MTLARGNRERTFNVRVTSELSAKAERNLVVTLDDITDLVTAQRTSAWADVARRIAHEIKNPLTPIQLSAERLKRRYSKVITEGRDVFDQCTDTIIRQVDDIKRMVDEFSSFARMPKAMLAEDDLVKCVGQVAVPDAGRPSRHRVRGGAARAGPLIARFDRRLLSQALTNIVKNATEGVAAYQATLPPRRASRGASSVKLHTAADGQAVIDVVDNGKGFPAENRQRLLEPYMTTRERRHGPRPRDRRQDPRRPRRRHRAARCRRATAAPTCACISPSTRRLRPRPPRRRARSARKPESAPWPPTS